MEGGVGGLVEVLGVVEEPGVVERPGLGDGFIGSIGVGVIPGVMTPGVVGVGVTMGVLEL